MIFLAVLIALVTAEEMGLLGSRYFASNPPVPKDNIWNVNVDFAKPGTFVVRCQAHDGVLMNTAIATAKNPVLMASAMKKAVEAGREAFLAGRMPKKPYAASPSSPTGGLIGKP